MRWAGPVPVGSMPVVYRQEQAEGTLPALLAIWCRRCHGNLVFFSPFSVSWNRAGSDFWMLDAGGTLSQEVRGEGKPLFWAGPQQGPGELPAEPLALLVPIKGPRAPGSRCP